MVGSCAGIFSRSNSFKIQSSVFADKSILAKIFIEIAFGKGVRRPIGMLWREVEGDPLLHGIAGPCIIQKSILDMHCTVSRSAGWMFYAARAILWVI